MKYLTVAEWKSLPKLQFAMISDPHKEKGRVYRVKKVDSFNPRAYDPAGVKQFPEAAEGLPIVIVVRDDKEIMYRLPLELMQWVQTAIGLAMNGMNAFPCDVEFGVVDDRHYAEML